jgi:glycosyltransferase involved in cell wall biosynthesis
MSKTPLVSILMPCYNAEATISEALESLSRQTLGDFEVILVDDGSADDTPNVLSGWTRRDPRFHLYCQSHAGIILALNYGVQYCSAPYLARMDSDDLTRPQRLEKQVDYLEAHPEVSLVSCLVEGYPHEQVREGFRIYIAWLNSLVSDEEIRREIFIESPFAHPSIMLRKAWLEKVGGYRDNGWAEDYDLWLRLYIHGACFAKLDQVLLSWRERPERLTRTDPRYSVENFIRAKAYYLGLGPLVGRDAVIIWGAGMMGRRLSKHLLRQGIPVTAFIDIDPAKIGRTRRGLPILAPEALPGLWNKFANPTVLAAVGSRGARQLIRQRLVTMGLREGIDWWSTA